MKKYLTILFGLVVVLSCKTQTTNKVDDSETTPTEKAIELVDATDLKSAIANNKIQLIDVRTPEEFADGHIESAVNIDFLNDNFEEQIQKINKENPVYIYCRSGGRSGRAAQAMEKLGFKKVYDLKGGYSGWE